MINNAPSHYQRHDFKNRRSSSEPANEQKPLPHIQNSHNTTAIYPNTNSSHTNNNSSLVIDDASSTNPDDFIDCLHQKTIKVSEKQQSENTFYSLAILLSRYITVSLNLNFPVFLNLVVLSICSLLTVFFNPRVLNAVWREFSSVHREGKL